jgi:hypothetical protein
LEKLRSEYARISTQWQIAIATIHEEHERANLAHSLVEKVKATMDIMLKDVRIYS